MQIKSFERANGEFGPSTATVKLSVSEVRTLFNSLQEMKKSAESKKEKFYYDQFLADMFMLYRLMEHGGISEKDIQYYAEEIANSEKNTEDPDRA